MNMEKINLAKASLVTSPNPLSIVCTLRDDGLTNIATVSWYTYLSYNPEMLAYAMAKTSFSGEMMRKHGHAVLTIPGEEEKDLVLKAGTTTGRKINKVETFGNKMADIPGTDIKVPEGTACAISLTLDHFEEAGDHYLYICRVDAVYQDKGRKSLFAFDGYSKIKTAE